MAPPPIMLLDEDQQRTLQTGPVGSNGRSSSNAGLHNMRNSSFGAYPTTPLSDHHHQRGDPRSNYTTGPRNDFRTDFRSEPRTNFTSAAMADRQNERMLHDHVEATGGRATNMTNGTFNSSPKTNFTSRRVAPDFDPTYADYTPMMMSDRLSDTLSNERDDDDAAGYAGSSSGLHISVTYILIGVALGVGLGIMISTIKVSELTARWIVLPGDLFLRAMKALVIPYVFCSVAVAIGDIVFVGKVSVVGLQTFKVFVMMWFTTAVLGMSVALLFRPMFRLDRNFVAAPTNAVGLTCQNGMLLQMQNDASLMCTGNATSGISGSAAFELKDTNGVFEKDVKRALALMTVSEQVIAMLNLIVPSNIFQTLAKGDLLSTITFAMVFGAVAGRAYFTKTRRVNYVYLVLLQLRNTFFLAMEWVIWLTPVAVVSIIAGSFATNQDAFKQLGDVYMYVVAVLITAVLQMLVTQPTLIFLLTRCNPYRHMSYMARAYAFAFGVSSSLVTAPVSLACVKKARVCSQSLANFVISIGASSNMSGMGIYLPIAIIFLAESSGAGDELTTWRLVAIFLLTLLACAGTPPIPNAGVALMATLYKTVFGVSDLPVTFTLYIAVDFLVDRIVTTCNVNDDIMALKVIAENTDETIVGDHLGERE